MKTSAPIQYRQYILSTVSILLVSVLCFTVRDSINYKATALILLFTVSIIAMLFDILPVLLSAFLSAVIWNFFFISPQFTLDISDTEDLLMFLSYFVIALLNTVLTFKIRQAERKARDKEEKEQTIKLYNTLLNSLSHELRTPIATILGTVDILKEACHNHKLNFSQQMDLLNDIDIATVRLNRQVKNILNLNRIESGILKPKADWCDINELINSILQKIKITEGHEIYFTSNENLPLFKLDIGFTEQILLNIIHNAVQYTPKNSIIKIDVNYESKSCKIVISDNGNGIPESEHVLIFDKFKRLPDSKTRGTGLGLSIVKGFAEAQGGTVTLENNIPHGSIFTIQIPAETSYINHLKNE